jgi:hypothetical protein
LVKLRKKKEEKAEEKKSGFGKIAGVGKRFAKGITKKMKEAVFEEQWDTRQAPEEIPYEERVRQHMAFIKTETLPTYELPPEHTIDSPEGHWEGRFNDTNIYSKEMIDFDRKNASAHYVKAGGCSFYEMMIARRNLIKVLITSNVQFPYGAKDIVITGEMKAGIAHLLQCWLGAYILQDIQELRASGKLTDGHPHLIDGTGLLIQSLKQEVDRFRQISAVSRIEKMRGNEDYIKALREEIEEYKEKWPESSKKLRARLEAKIQYLESQEKATREILEREERAFVQSMEATAKKMEDQIEKLEKAENERLERLKGRAIWVDIKGRIKGEEEILSMTIQYQGKTLFTFDWPLSSSLFKNKETSAWADETLDKYARSSHRLVRAYADSLSPYRIKFGCNFGNEWMIPGPYGRPTVMSGNSGATQKGGILGILEYVGKEGQRKWVLRAKGSLMYSSSFIKTDFDLESALRVAHTGQYDHKKGSGSFPVIVKGEIVQHDSSLTNMLRGVLIFKWPKEMKVHPKLKIPMFKDRFEFTLYKTAEKAEE